MQLVNQARKILYVAVMAAILYQLGNSNLSGAKNSWSSIRQAWEKLGQFKSTQEVVPQKSAVSQFIQGTQPLVMKGGDPHIRALMRTITASEANVASPYNVIYGGTIIEDLSQHPELCVAIAVGPNRGNCSTAAGRYQMLDFTWAEKAQKYHSQPRGFWRWRSYSFEPQFQDEVVHSWLSDQSAWGQDISTLLQRGQINQVLRLLSGTWTSLGYGIETNSMSHHLPQIFEELLQEELG